MKRIILSAIIFALSSSAFAQNCEFTLPYFEQFESAEFEGGLPSCMYSTYNSFASSEIFEVSPAPVEGFTGRVAQYNLNTSLTDGGEYQIENDLYIGNFFLEEGKNYTFSYKYGHSGTTHPVALRAILQSFVQDEFAYLITNMQQMPNEIGTITQTLGVPATGLYILHFEVITMSSDNFVYLDDVRLEEAPTAALQQNTLTGLSVYPNPAGNVVTISNNEVINNVDLYNSMGQMVLRAAPNATEATLNLDTLAAGVYFASVKSGSKTTKTKIIKK